MVHLIQLLSQKMQYLQNSAFEMTRNIAKADMPAAKRMELRPFEKLLKKTSRGTELNLGAESVVNTQEQINRESESLNLQTVTMDYQSMIHIYKRYHDMIRMVIGKN